MIVPAQVDEVSVAFSDSHTFVLLAAIIGAFGLVQIPQSALVLIITGADTMLVPQVF